MGQHLNTNSLTLVELRLKIVNSLTVTLKEVLPIEYEHTIVS